MCKKVSLYSIIILISGSVLATKICNNVGLFPSDVPEKFLLCRDKDGVLIRSELDCSNRTVYSGHGARCKSKNQPDIQIYNLLSSGLNVDNNEVEIGCVTAGTICSTCSELSVCAGDVDPDGSESLKVLYTEKCPPGQHCAFSRGCTSDEQYPCSLGPFQCDDVGPFPDPYDCKKYHVCKAANLDRPTTAICSTGSFSSQTMSCGYSMDSKECQMRPVPLCRELFQIGQVTNNARMYYICVESRSEKGALTPSLHACPPDHIFNVNTFSCTHQVSSADNEAQPDL